MLVVYRVKPDDGVIFHGIGRGGAPIIVFLRNLLRQVYVLHLLKSDKFAAFCEMQEAFKIRQCYSG